MNSATKIAIGSAAVVAAGLGLAALLPSGEALRSDFDAGDNGWRVTGDAQQGSVLPNVKDGYLEAVDDAVGGVWYWRGPSAYHGNLCAFYGGSLTFSLRQSATDEQFEDSDVIIDGLKGRLVYDLPSSPGEDWTHFSVPIEAGPGWAGEPSEADMKAVLANVTDLFVRGEYRSGDDTGGLMGVSLDGPGVFGGAFSSTEACDVLEVKKTVRIVEATAPFEADVETLPAGGLFRVRIEFEEPPETDSEPVVIRSDGHAEELELEAFPTDDPHVYLTDPVAASKKG